MTITREPRRVMYVYGLQTSQRDSLLRGNIYQWLRDERIPAQYFPRLRGWRVRTDRVGDIIARAETAGITVRMRGVYVAPEPAEDGVRRLRPAPVLPPVTAVAVDGQLALLEVGDAR